jgi:hypothetical protein
MAKVSEKRVRDLGLTEFGRILLRNEQFHDFLCSPNIIRVIISRRMIWACHVYT